MSNHTPGPWKVEDKKGAGLEIHAPVQLVDTVQWMRPVEGPLMTYRLADPEGMMLIAHERWVQFEPEGWHDMQVANAQLISAAPDLLAACEGFSAAWGQDEEIGEDEMNELGNALSMALKAIKKAKGQL